MKKFLIALALLPVLFVAWMNYVAYQCRNFPIDYSSAASKVFVVTGANSGLGFYTALALARAGATVVIGCRDDRKCAAAKMGIAALHPPAKVENIQLDLSSFRSIKQFAKEFKTKHAKLDVLINNAGVMAIATRERTADGLEMQIGTNHFGHFLLTALLYPSMAANGRIINHSSSAHVFADSAFPLEDLQSEAAYSPFTAYGNSKLANLLFTFELNKRLSLAGNPKNLTSIAVHPGYSSTNLQENRFPFWKQLNGFFAMHARDGALSQIFAAVDPSAAASVDSYIGPRFMAMGVPAVQSTSAASQDGAKQAKLWEESVRLTGKDFDFHKLVSSTKVLPRDH